MLCEIPSIYLFIYSGLGTISWYKWKQSLIRVVETAIKVVTYLRIMDSRDHNGVWFDRLHVHHQAELQIAIALKT